MKSARYLILAMLLVAIVSGMGTPAYAAQGEEAEFAPVPYYGREVLSNLDNGDALLYAYDQIVAGVECSAETIDVVKDDYVISTDEIDIVFDAYVRDHTEHFWLGNSYSISYNSKTVVAIEPAYAIVGLELDKAKEEFELAAKDMLSGITRTMSEFDRELVVHNRLGAAVSYAESPQAHNAYGALVQGYAVCEGYAKAFQYLLHRVGIQSFLIQGYGLNPSGQVEAHEWNAVRIDGKFYHVDLTWNDQGNNLFHAYFNLPTVTMAADHIMYDAAYELPVCDSIAANFFEVKGGKLETYDVKTVAAILKKNDFIAEFYLLDDGGLNRFVSWISEHLRELVDEMGLRGSIFIGNAVIGREIIFQFRPESVSHDFGIWYMTSAPTCTGTGVEARVCGNCDHTETRDIEPYGHTYSDTVTPSTCLNQGYTTHTCTVCGDSYTDSYTDALGHNYTPVVTEPTCTEQGYTTHTCENCGDVYVDTYVDATGHALENKIENRRAYHVCANCDYREETGVLQAEEVRVSITLDACPEQAEIYVVVFTSEGQMKGLQLVTVTVNHAEFTLSDVSQTNSIKAFFLGGQHAPWMNAMDIVLS